MPAGKKITKGFVTLAEGGPTLEAEFSPIGLLALHRPLPGSKVKGFVLTHAPSGMVLGVYPLKRIAAEVRTRLEALDWTFLERVRTEFERLDQPAAEKQPLP